MESAHQQRTVAQPFSSTHSPRLFPNSASAQRPLRPFTLLAPSLEGSLEGSVILCPKNTKTATLTTFRINTCKSVSKQRTLTPFRMNTYEKTGGGGRGLSWYGPGTSLTEWTGSIPDTAELWQLRVKQAHAMENEQCYGRKTSLCL